MSPGRTVARPVHLITPGDRRGEFSNRIATYGMCTSEREILGSGEFVGFGASELMSAGLKSGIIDCAVIASDGAGTVVVSSPEFPGNRRTNVGTCQDIPHPGDNKKD